MHSEHNLLTNFVPAIHFSIALPVIVQFLNLDSFSAYATVREFTPILQDVKLHDSQSMSNVFN